MKQGEEQAAEYQMVEIAFGPWHAVRLGADKTLCGHRVRVTERRSPFGAWATGTYLCQNCARIVAREGGRR